MNAEELARRRHAIGQGLPVDAETGITSEWSQDLASFMAYNPAWRQILNQVLTEKWFHVLPQEVVDESSLDGFGFRPDAIIVFSQLLGVLIPAQCFIELDSGKPMVRRFLASGVSDTLEPNNFIQVVAEAAKTIADSDRRLIDVYKTVSKDEQTEQDSDWSSWAKPEIDEKVFDRSLDAIAQQLDIVKAEEVPEADRQRMQKFLEQIAAKCGGFDIRSLNKSQLQAFLRHAVSIKNSEVGSRRIIFIPFADSKDTEHIYLAKRSKLLQEVYTSEGPVSLWGMVANDYQVVGCHWDNESP